MDGSECRATIGIDVENQMVPKLSGRAHGFGPVFYMVHQLAKVVFKKSL